MKALWEEYDKACACADISMLALRMGRENDFHTEQNGFWNEVKRNLRITMRELPGLPLPKCPPLLPG